VPVPSIILRIDDRLVHGQVIVGWGSYYPIQEYAVVDDEIAANEWERNLLIMAVPPTVEAQVLTIPHGVAYIRKHLNAPGVRMVLVSSPRQILQMDALGLPLKTVNVGGMHFREGRKQYLNYLFLNAEEVHLFRQLMEKGYTFECQDVPTSGKVDLIKVLERTK